MVHIASRWESYRERQMLDALDAELSCPFWANARRAKRIGFCKCFQHLSTVCFELPYPPDAAAIQKVAIKEGGCPQHLTHRWPGVGQVGIGKGCKTSLAHTTFGANASKDGRRMTARQDGLMCSLGVGV